MRRTETGLEWEWEGQVAALQGHCGSHLQGHCSCRLQSMWRPQGGRGQSPARGSGFGAGDGDTRKWGQSDGAIGTMRWGQGNQHLGDGDRSGHDGIRVTNVKAYGLGAVTGMNALRVTGVSDHWQSEGSSGMDSRPRPRPPPPAAGSPGAQRLPGPAPPATPSRRDSEHHQEVQQLYDEMEQQIRREKQQLQAEVAPPAPRPDPSPGRLCRLSSGAGPWPVRGSRGLAGGGPLTPLAAGIPQREAVGRAAPQNPPPPTPSLPPPPASARPRSLGLHLVTTSRPEPGKLS